MPLNISEAELTHSSPPPLKNPDQACGLYAPHSSALIDIDGDCLPGRSNVLSMDQAHRQISFYTAPNLIKHITLSRYG